MRSLKKLNMVYFELTKYLILKYFRYFVFS